MGWLNCDFIVTSLPAQNFRGSDKASRICCSASQESLTHPAGDHAETSACHIVVTDDVQ
ncbi:hypothetical protein F441_16655 [Phytophthora nicotianae CJ01A1]|uniref:Uncharacterized protein n=5 Tax=Phytophthora nicotianae TaxID=4792 RepID=W2PNZ2_PHYN3|nr:hypothetical protein PPTG_23904 [Phytophthora nicotianae INRA-310]ETI37155.1 hypothetical protein F443_16817 [Phytophthora nicotianae P1569]ETK77365.1 hypothetical protein L915_16354 [Phytophthora nicotianae]ETO65896.1 hypothetical protein F444_16830 [Phytophthora nicotianae P1976]ETP07001.1 hypothetical protein F441_16655 [Phytophthora nicotianae CJ01A1]ETL30808.1 hypothetical protein L916_16248 [Phytophthora nicotianae]